MNSTSSRPSESAPSLQALDALTHGAFTAATSSERAQRVREWLQSEPATEQIQWVFRELQTRDKGAARPLRERLDELKRARDQESIAVEWAAKAKALLDLSRLNIADALAWQRDAARAGAPLSRDPLAALKTQLAERVKSIEDLQHRVQVQREAAVLLAQRIELLSTKSWVDAGAASESLGTDVAQWGQSAEALVSDPAWSSVDAKFPPLLDASRNQLQAVWEAFSAALQLTRAAVEDAGAALPPVPVWAEEIRQLRGVASPEPHVVKPGKALVDPEQKARAMAKVTEALNRLEKEIGEGHGKASAGAAGALRSAFSDGGRLIDAPLEARVHAALAAASELEGWQRWRADQLREELVQKAEGLLQRPEGQALGGRKMQETLRALREQWKQTDQGGVPNHALWKRFDEACNAAHKVVESWLEKVRHEAAEHRAHRLALIEEVKAWGVAQRAATESAPTAVPDWKAVNRALHQFGDRWRDAGHVGEKAFAELQPLWRTAIQEAAAPLEAAQSASVARRNLLIEEARALGGAAQLRIDAVKALQARWQTEAHTVPVERRLEQKLWDAFRQPIDEAFNRKTQEREKAAAALGAHDAAVLAAAKALDVANAAGDAQQIRAAMSALEAATRSSTGAVGSEAPATLEPVNSAPAPAPAAAGDEAGSTAPAASASVEAGAVNELATETPSAQPAAPRKPVVAVRGDDRPGARGATAQAQNGRVAAPAGGAARGVVGRRGDGAGSRPGTSDRGARDPAASRFGGYGRDSGREAPPRGPRLGDVAFRAQRDAMDRAQQVLRRLAEQSHGEVLSQLVHAWEQRNVADVPALQALGKRINAAQRGTWIQSIGKPQGSADASANALLRMEMAAEVPTPAEHQNARRALQLQLLTRRNEAPPAQTWTSDAASVFEAEFRPDSAKRLIAALKVLMR